MRESIIEKKTCDAARAAGWLVHPKAARGNRGWPDRTFSHRRPFFETNHAAMKWRHRVLFVEFKAPGKRPTKQQAKRHRELMDEGYEVHVIDSVEAGVALFA